MQPRFPAAAAELLTLWTRSSVTTKNPLQELEEAQQKDEEDTDVELIPDFFAQVRKYFTTGAPDYAPSRLLRMGQAGGFALGLVFIVSGVIVLSGSNPMMGIEETHPALAAIETIGRGAGLAFASVLPVDLAAAIHPSSGALALLGLKTQKVSARTLRRLRHWSKLASLGLLGCAGFALFCCTFMALTAVSFAGDMRIME